MSEPQETKTLLALFNEGKLKEAAALAESMIELYPTHGFAWKVLGLLYKNAGRKALAQVIMQHAIALSPNDADGYNNLGNLLRENNQLHEAERALLHALELKPKFVEALNNYGSLLQESMRFPEAEAAFLRAIELKPDYADAYYNLGNLFLVTKQMAKAEAAYLRALKLRMTYAETYNNLGIVYKETKRLPEAVAAFRRALELKPDYADAKWGLGVLLLIQGQYAEAWPYHESRYDPNRTNNTIAMPSLPFPQWRGESLKGKSMLICPEQGYGDYIQFARYAPLLKRQGVSTLTLICAQPLKALLETVEGVDTVITDPASILPHDFWSFPLSLPLYFETTVDTIPNCLPYLHATPKRMRFWNKSLARKTFGVGLVWKGSSIHTNDANRSLPGLTTLAPLWSVSGVTFFSLQIGQGEMEAKQPPPAQPIINLGPDIRDFADTSAIVAQLDLVICVDTAVAHVAGALGKPCWVLIPAFGTDWRWLQDRTGSPWYPGALRIFRQKTPDEWDDTVGEVVTMLKTLVSNVNEKNSLAPLTAPFSR
jgi:tetratricopeptide (TPR) repeat protein